MAAPTDPLFQSQWHFKLLGDISTIWNDYSGRGISVGIYDDGVQYTHPDLNDTYDAAKHFTFDGTIYDPSPIALLRGSDSDGHGTSVAGLIAGEANNGIGGTGVAYGAKVTGVNVLADDRFFADTDDSTTLVLAAFRHAANFDIMSNSWGYIADYTPNQNRADRGSDISKIEDAFGYAAANGRGGLGTVIVKSAANDALNANGEGLNGSRFLIDVAAIAKTGAVTDYSNFGTNILISAAAASVTTDLMGANGYNTRSGAKGNYASDFGGTSAAAPLVSGVVALMLEANAALGWRDVREILATSAALTGRAVDSKIGFETMQVTSQATGNWNGGGRVFSDDYGFGRLDAFAAVRMAEAWTLWTNGAKTSANEQHFKLSTPDGFSSSISNNGPYPALSVGDEIWIEHIDVTISFSYSAFLPIPEKDFLRFNLIAPDGTSFEFFDAADQVIPDNALWDPSTGFTWTFGIAQALGLRSLGTWVLEDVSQGGVARSGVVTDFTLDIYGTANDQSGDDIHHITSDFLRTTSAKAAIWNGGRDRFINDINGGTDWLNMAAIAGAVTISLGDAGNILVAGKQWASLSAGAAVENLVTGDGADKITGSALANEIHAMRGADIIRGLAGGDSLFGGAGADKIYGGADADHLNGDAGNDVLDGGLGDDVAYGGSGADIFAEAAGGGNDIFYGGTGRDRASMGAGNDVFYDAAENGRAGADTVKGGSGDDSLFGGGGADSLMGDAGSDSIMGGDGNDVLAGGDGDDWLSGDANHDKIAGGTGNDTMLGGAGNDSLLGGLGADLIEGGAGSDVLTGGSASLADADTFVFNAGFGADKITDFRDNVDTLAFAAAFWGDVSVSADFVTTFARQIGGNVVFDFTDGNTVTVVGLRSLTGLFDDIFIF